MRLRALFRADWGKLRVRDHRMDAIASAYRSRRAHLHEPGSLDDRTWADLDLDAVFRAIDRTSSTLGQAALYCRLHAAPVSLDLGSFEALVARMATDAPARERAQIGLARLQDPQGYDVWWLARPSAIESRGWYAVFPWLTVATVTLTIATIVWHSVFPFLVALLVVDLGVRLVAADRVSRLGTAFGQIAPIVASGEELAFLQTDAHGSWVRTIASDARQLRHLKTIARWLSGDPLMASFFPDALTMAVASLAHAVYEYVNLVLLLDGNLVYFAAREIRARRESLLRVTSALGDVDAAISVASWRQERSDWTRPRFHASASKAIMANVRHPLVAGAVPNTIALEPGRGVLVTGSNMSGKSTFLRTVGVATVLAQTINTCLASEYDAPIFQVQSCIGRADDLMAGKSYYLVEVEAVLSRVQASGSPAPHLFLFDELFRGTNAVERIAAGEAVLRELLGDASQHKPHVVVAATHDAELVELVSDCYRSYHFTDTIGPEGLVFEYRLEEGPATTRNAIALLELHDAPESIVRRALSRAAMLDRQRGRQDAWKSQKADH
jgi:hypothetical protein